MIRVRVRRQGQRVAALTVVGHAGSGPAGRDLVCAAVSALVETLQLAVRQMGGTGWEGTVEPGQACFRFGQSLGAQAQAVVEAMVLGLEDLARSHPRYVRLKVSEQEMAERGEWHAAAAVRAQKGGRQLP
jgi:uncharacterized protein YsxB (DUF464 family)